MANLITQIEIMKFTGMEKAVFPVGTIVTPSAKDWAKDHKIEIIIGEREEKKNIAYGTDKSDFLRYTAKCVIESMEKAGGFLKRDELVEIITVCLERMGCTVEK